MSGEDLPKDVLAFIFAHVHSVGALELLLLLQGQPQREWQPKEFESELRIGREFARAEIDRFIAAGIVARIEGTDRCLYKPVTLELDESVRKLVLLYCERRVTVIQAIYSKPIDPVQSFADAFRIRRDQDVR